MAYLDCCLGHLLVSIGRHDQATVESKLAEEVGGGTRYSSEHHIVIHYQVLGLGMHYLFILYIYIDSCKVAYRRDT